MSNLFPDITGVLYEEEQSKLHEIAKTTTHPIVNIGVYQGLSTAQLASGTKQSVYAIDIWDGIVMPLKPRYQKVFKLVSYRRLS